MFKIVFGGSTQDPAVKRKVEDAVRFHLAHFVHMPKQETFRMIDAGEELIYEGIKTRSNKIVITSVEDVVIVDRSDEDILIG